MANILSKRGAAATTILSFSISVLLVIPFSSAFSDSASFNSTVNLSGNPGESFLPEIAQSGSNIYSVWNDNSGGNADVLLVRSTNNGATFGTPVNLSNNVGQSSTPKIAAAGSNVHVVWSDNSGGNPEIYFARSDNSGATFSAPVNLSNNTGFSYAPQLAVSGSNVYVAWNDNSGGNLDVYLARSGDNGATFTAPVNLSNNAGFSYTPQLAVSGSNVYVVWNDDTDGNLDIFSATSNNNGTGFGAPVNLSNSPGLSYTPQLAASGSNVYVAWNDDSGGDADVMFVRSNSSGALFDTAVDLSNNDGFSYTPQLAASGSSVYVVWNDNSDGNADVLFAKSDDSGGAFGTAVNLSDPLNLGGAYSAYERIALSNSVIYVVWQGSSHAEINSFSDPLDIYLATSADGGNSFDMPVNLSNSAGQSFFPQMVTSATGASVVWHDKVGNNFEILSTNNYQVAYQYSGILQPINEDGSSVFKLGSTVPVKFQLTDASGNFVTTAVARLYVAKVTNSVVGDQTEAVSSGNANTGNLFNYDTASNQYIFVLGTKNLSKGTWQLTIELDNGTSHTAIISLK